MVEKAKAAGSTGIPSKLALHSAAEVQPGKVLANQEPIGGDAQSGVMMKSAPSPSFIVA